MTIQDQYTNSIRQTQEAWAEVVESLTGNLQTFAKPENPFAIVDPVEAVDQVFDFWEKTLEAQREVATQLIRASVAAGEKLRTQAESVGSAVREQTETAVRAVREQTETAREAARDEVSERYETLTKVELQDELASRGLPKSGNVDELRARLLEDDVK